MYIYYYMCTTICVCTLVHSQAYYIVCMYVCIYYYICTTIYVYMLLYVYYYVCMHARPLTGIQQYIHAICTALYVLLYVCAFLYTVHVCSFFYVCVCILTLHVLCVRVPLCVCFFCHLCVLVLALHALPITGISSAVRLVYTAVEPLDYCGAVRLLMLRCR